MVTLITPKVVTREVVTPEVVTPDPMVTPVVTPPSTSTKKQTAAGPKRDRAEYMRAYRADRAEIMMIRAEINLTSGVHFVPTHVAEMFNQLHAIRAPISLRVTKAHATRRPSSRARDRKRGIRCRDALHMTRP